MQAIKIRNCSVHKRDCVPKRITSLDKEQPQQILDKLFKKCYISAAFKDFSFFFFLSSPVNLQNFYLKRSLGMEIWQKQPRDPLRSCLLAYCSSDQSSGTWLLGATEFSGDIQVSMSTDSVRELISKGKSYIFYIESFMRGFDGALGPNFLPHIINSNL